MLVTLDVDYGDPGSVAQTANVFQTIECPAGSIVVNAGILQIAVDDDDWEAKATAALDGGHVQPGSASLLAAGENGFDSSADPVNLSVPRPVDDGASWRVGAHLVYPYWENPMIGQNGTAGMTVTYFAEYISIC